MNPANIVASLGREQGPGDCVEVLFPVCKTWMDQSGRVIFHDGRQERLPWIDCEDTCRVPPRGIGADGMGFEEHHWRRPRPAVVGC